jgi:hypothetical protein
MSLRDNYIFDLDENVTRRQVSYKNRFGITIAADLYRPKEFDESREYAAIIVGAPYGGVKEQGPGIYAQNMALRGSSRSPSTLRSTATAAASRATSPPPTSSSRTSAQPSTTWAHGGSSTGTGEVTSRDRACDPRAAPPPSRRGNRRQRAISTPSTRPARSRRARHDI